MIMTMQICYVPVSKIESEVRVRAASRGMGERKTLLILFPSLSWFFGFLTWLEKSYQKLSVGKFCLKK